MASVLRVCDIMTTDVTHVDADATIFDAARILTDTRVAGAPVLDGAKIVGMVSKSDLIAPKNELEARVDRVMTRVVYAVRPHDPAMLAVQLMVDEEIHRVLVVDEDGLAGIVAPIDVCRAVRDGRSFSMTDDSGRVQLQYVDLRHLISTE